MRTAALFMASTLALAAPSSGQEDGARLTVLVTGAETGVGQVVAALYSGEANFTAAMGSRGAIPPQARDAATVDAEGQAALVFDGLAAGEYAVSVHYDRDSDGEVDTGLFGIPTEKVGFSNNVFGSFGPPGWRDAHFDVGGDGAEITVALKRPEM